uniref:TIR domain-containing protein n=1 Tax=Frankia sp. Cr1 TaxID=3073931 RepID=UPI002AD2E9B9
MTDQPGDEGIRWWDACVVAGGVDEGWDYFVSYTAVDRPWAEWIAWVLEEAGYRVLVQAWDFAPGVNWVVGMDEGVSRARRTVAVLSSAYADSVYGRAEWHAAWERDPAGTRRLLLVVRVEDCARPRLLAQITSIDLFGRAESVARLELVRAASLAVSGERNKPDRAPLFPSDARAVPSRGLALRAVPSPVEFPGSDQSPPAHARRSVNLLPAVPPRYVERRVDTAALLDLLTDPQGGPVLGVVGMGGAGKSTLARVLVRDPAVLAAFPDGIVWVNVGPEPQIIAILAEILTSLGDTAPVFDPDSGAERLRRLLAGAACLIVADDVWQVDLLRTLPLSSPARLLVTTRTREALFADSTVYELGAVDAGTARLVLAAYAGCAADELPTEAEVVLGHCGGLVLALALAAGMVAGGRRWASVAERLRRAELNWLAGQFADYPYPDLLASLYASVSSLRDEQAARLRELAVFEGRGPVPASVVAVLWRATSGMDDLDSDDLIALFGQRSLIQTDPRAGTVTVHDLLMRYIRTSLPAGRLPELHGLLAESFLSRWGAVGDGLPALRGETSPDGADRYAIAGMIAHLLAAHRHDLVDALLTAEEQGGGDRQENVWYKIHYYLGLTGAYLTGIRAVWQDAERMTDQAAAAEIHGPDSFGREIFCALIFGSIASISANIPPRLLSRLVTERYWTPEQAVSYAHSISDPGSRAEALTALVPHIPGGARGPVVADALDTLTTVDEAHFRARALTELVPYLPDDDRERVLGQA